MTTDYASIKSAKRGVVLAAVGGQFALIFFTFCTMPGYIMPFLNNPIARIVIFFMLLWQVMGVALYAFSPNTPQRHILFAFQNTILVVVFVMPLLAAIFLGPSVSQPQHLDAIGPALNGIR